MLAYRLIYKRAAGPEILDRGLLVSPSWSEPIVPFGHFFSGRRAVDDCPVEKGWPPDCTRLSVPRGLYRVS